MINSKRIYFFNLLMALLPSSACSSLKASVLRWAGAKVGKQVELFQGFKVQGIGELEIGDCAFIGHQVLMLLNEDSKILIEESAVISSQVLISTGFHPITPNGERIIGREGTSSTIIVKRGAGVMARAVLLPGVTVGEMALVAAGSIVNKDVKAYSLAGGCPAKWIRDLKNMEVHD